MGKPTDVLRLQDVRRFPQVGEAYERLERSSGKPTNVFHRNRIEIARTLPVPQMASPCVHSTPDVRPALPAELCTATVPACRALEGTSQGLQDDHTAQDYTSLETSLRLEGKNPTTC